MGTLFRRTSRDSPVSCWDRGLFTAPSRGWKSEASSSRWSPMTVGVRIESRPQGRPTCPRPWPRCSVWPMKVPDDWPLPTRCRSLGAVRESPEAWHEQRRGDDKPGRDDPVHAALVPGPVASPLRRRVQRHDRRRPRRKASDRSLPVDDCPVGAERAAARRWPARQLGAAHGAGPGRRLDGLVRICAVRHTRRRLRQNKRALGRVNSAGPPRHVPAVFFNLLGR